MLSVVSRKYKISQRFLHVSFISHLYFTAYSSRLLAWCFPLLSALVLLSWFVGKFFDHVPHLVIFFPGLTFRHVCAVCNDVITLITLSYTCNGATVARFVCPWLSREERRTGSAVRVNVLEGWSKVAKEELRTWTEREIDGSVLELTPRFAREIFVQLKRTPKCECVMFVLTEVPFCLLNHCFSLDSREQQFFLWTLDSFLSRRVRNVASLISLSSRVVVCKSCRSASRVAQLCWRLRCVMNTNLSPFVYWAQTKDAVSLRVDLKEVKVSSIFDESSRDRSRLDVVRGSARARWPSGSTILEHRIRFGLHALGNALNFWFECLFLGVSKLTTRRPPIHSILYRLCFQR